MLSGSSFIENKDVSLSADRVDYNISNDNWMNNNIMINDFFLIIIYTVLSGCYLIRTVRGQTCIIALTISPFICSTALLSAGLARIFARILPTAEHLRQI